MIVTLVIILIASVTAYFLTFRGYLLYRMDKRKHESCFGKNEKPPKLILVKEWNGHRFYVHENILEISAYRSEKIEFYSRWASLNMMPDLFRKQMLEAVNALDNQKFSEASAIMQDLIDRSELAAEEQTLLNLAAHLIIMDDENPRIVNAELNKKKIEIIQSEEGLKGFFIMLAYSSLRNIGALSETDLLEYLKIQEANRNLGIKNSRLLRVLSQSQNQSTPLVSRSGRGPSAKSKKS